MIMETQVYVPATKLPSQNRITIIEASAGRARKLLLQQQLDSASQSGTRVFVVECDFDKGGPWVGPHELLATLIEDIQVTRPDLVAKHSLELTYVMPQLRHLLSVKNPTLTDLAPAEERVRSYPVDRAFRIVHGLIDLLCDWKETAERNSSWFIACDNFDQSGTMTRRFFIELIRRKAESMGLKIILAVNPGAGEEAHQHLEMTGQTVSVMPVQLPILPEPKTSPSECQTAAEMIEERIGANRVEILANLPKLIQLWKHAERPDKVMHYRYLALDYHNTLGLYEDSLRYADGLLEMYAQYAPDNEYRRWAIAAKVLNIYVGLMDAPTAISFAEQIIQEFAQRNEARLGVMLYTLAMLYARYQKPRNLRKGEEYLTLGLEALERARMDGSMSEDEYYFQTAFNRNGLAMIRNFEHRYTEAIQICRKCVEHLNIHLDAERHLLHRSVLLYNIGQVYNAMGKYQEAIEQYTAAIALDPNYSEYYNDRGSVHLHSGNLDQAEKDYLKAIELSPPYFEVFTNLGQCYRLMGQMDMAIQSYSRALDLEPRQILALLGRAKAYEELGNSEKALVDYTQAIAFDHSLWDAFASRGVIQYEIGNLDSSLHDLNRAIELNPKQGTLFENRATVHWELGHFSLAQQDLRTAIGLASIENDRIAIQARLDDLLGMVTQS
jgi:tetratricopeptide (TPR) repeat protein